MPRSRWFAAWASHHFSGIQKGAEQLFLYGPDLDNKKASLMTEANMTIAGEMTVVNPVGIRDALEKLWAAQGQETQTLMPSRLRNHAEQLFSLQDCLYRAKAAGAPWLFQADPDEVLDFGEQKSMAGMLAWADKYRHDAITFGSILHSVTMCFGPPLEADGTLGPADDWHHHFPCHMPTAECSETVGYRRADQMLTNIEEKTSFLMGNRCLGPRGRRKYLIRPSATEFLEVHTPPVWQAHHMGDDSGDAVIRHYQGLLKHGVEICAGGSRPSACKLERCREWNDEATCKTL